MDPTTALLESQARERSLIAALEAAKILSWCLYI